MAHILQLKIVLKGSLPKVWRRFLVSDFWTFDRLHRIIQKVMGWENYHLYMFKINRTVITLPVDEPLEEGDKNARKVKISECLDSLGQKFSYIYDFGDSWEHEISVEKIMGDNIENDKYPSCLGGENACPPEDSGGVYGYQEMLEIKKNTNHPQYEELIVDWLGEDFDPRSFDLEEVNRSLRRL